MRKVTTLVIFLLAFMACQLAQATDTITVAASDFPPYYIFKDNGKNKAFDISGFEVELDKELVRVAGLDLRYVPCPWVRCLKLLKEGKVDMVGTIIDLPKRRQFLEFIKPGYRLINGARKVFFYQRHSDKRLITNLMDLKRGIMLIGVVRGERYFPAFDQSAQISKFAVSSYSEGLDLLVKGKIDAVAIIEAHRDWLDEKHQHQVSAAEFVHSQDEIAHKALSKNGQAMRHKEALAQAMAEVISSGFIEALYQKYQQKID